MIIIGLTGSIGMGKTEAGKYFKKEKIDVFDCDKEVALLYEKKVVLKELEQAFPNIISNDIIDKVALSKIVFDDKNKLKKLEKILYERLKKKQSFWLRKKIREKKKVVVFDVPLLLETKSSKKYDLVVVVSSALEIQKRRVLARKDWNRDRLEQILKKQMPDKEKLKLANITIKTDRGKRYLYNAVKDIKEIVKLKKNRTINSILRDF